MEVRKSAIVFLLVIILALFALTALQLTGVINWPWYLILMPLWIPYLLCIACGIALCVYIVFYRIKKGFQKKHG